ncbi:MAG: hypothetical protein R3183_13800 [Oleiphilaceae bacterium]|nr:hypothetical protein [Oleiphilaceae bacterium]
MKGYAKLEVDKDFLGWLNQVWCEYLLLKDRPECYIRHEEIERKFLGIPLKSRVYPVSVNIPKNIAPLVYLTDCYLMDGRYARFEFYSNAYKNIPDLISLLEAGECWLDSDMLNLYDSLLQEREQQESNPAHSS